MDNQKVSIEINIDLLQDFTDALYGQINVLSSNLLEEEDLDLSNGLKDAYNNAQKESSKALLRRIIRLSKFAEKFETVNTEILGG